MKLQDVLPVSGLPRTGYPERCVMPWFGFDSEENWRNRKSPGPNGVHNVSYRLNSLGYRCPEFDAEAALRIVSIGCSYVFGEGLPQEALFHECFAERLRAEVPKSVVNWNIGVAGASNDGIARLLTRAVPALNPDIVMVHFTHAGRREYVTASGEWMTYSRGRKPTDPITKEIFRHFEALSSPADNCLNFVRNYLSVSALLKDRFWMFSISRAGEIEEVLQHMDAARYVGSLQAVDMARDGIHPGPESHHGLYHSYWDRFLSLGGPRRFG